MLPADPLVLGADILTAAQMRAAEQALIDDGVGVAALMDRAGSGAADYVWRIAGPNRQVTVLAGPGNNGGDGWVIARAIARLGGRVQVVMAAPPIGEAAREARRGFAGHVVDRQAGETAAGDVLVDCLYGTGLSRALSEPDLALLKGLAARHRSCVAVDLPSGVEADGGGTFGQDLPQYDLTLALGAWKPAHGLMPAMARMGTLRLVKIGCAPVAGAGRMLEGIRVFPPAPDAHKYTRGLLGVVVGEMPGAALMAARAAGGAGAGYVQLLSDGALAGPPDLVVKPSRHACDPDYTVILNGPGLGRDDAARHLLEGRIAGRGARPQVIDGDALSMLSPEMTQHCGHIIATPHAGELARLEKAYGEDGKGSKVDRALAMARHLGTVVAKGPDTVIANADGRWAMVPRASSWLSVAGSGDVLAGMIASRWAVMEHHAFEAACQGVWLHGRAADLLKGPFTAMALAQAVPEALKACL